MPAARRARFVSEYGVSPYDAGVLANDRELSAYFEAAARNSGKPKNVANWILNDLLSALSASSRAIADCPVPPEALAKLTGLIEGGGISGKQGKEVFAEMFATGKSPEAIIAEKGMKQESDTGAIEALCRQVIGANPKVVADYKAGKVSSINFLKGQVMKLSQGKANPNVVGEVLAKELS